MKKEAKGTLVKFGLDKIRVLEEKCKISNWFFFFSLSGYILYSVEWWIGKFEDFHIIVLYIISLVHEISKMK